jgi:hypothetical protein
VIDELVAERHDVLVHPVLVAKIDGGFWVGFVQAAEEGDVEASSASRRGFDLDRERPTREMLDQSPIWCSK